MKSERGQIAERCRSFGTGCALALLLAGLYGFPLRNFAGFTAVPGGLGDPRFNAFVLEHVYRWALGLEPSLWSPRIFFPFEDALAFSDSHLGTAAVYAVFSYSIGSYSRFLERRLKTDHDRSPGH